MHDSRSAALPDISFRAIGDAEILQNPASLQTPFDKAKAMDLKQIEYFVRVAELGSFTRASVVLNIAQPALSRQVRLLEVELRQNLLVRNGRGATPTEAGKVLLEHGRGILHQVERAREELGRVRGALAGRVAIGLPQQRGPGDDGAPDPRVSPGKAARGGDCPSAKGLSVCHPRSRSTAGTWTSCAALQRAALAATSTITSTCWTRTWCWCSAVVAHRPVPSRIAPAPLAPWP